MGILEAFGQAPEKVANDLLSSMSEKARRQDAALRVAMYQDAYEADAREVINEVFRAQEVRDRIHPFVPMATAASIAKRVVDEVARHVYNPWPARHVSSPEGASAYQSFVREARLDQRLDTAARLLEMCNAVGLAPRYSAGLDRRCLDVLTPDMFAVIPHPDDPTAELAVIVDVYTPGKDKPDRDIWDDVSVTRIDAAGRVVSVRPNPYGIIPHVIVHKRERWGAYWDTTTGRDLIAAQRAICLLQALVLKLHKSQGERQLVVQGDTASTIQNQVLDSEAALAVPEGTNITALDLRSSAEHYTATINAITERIAANYGISRERLNAAGRDVTTSDVALIERRAELLQTWVTAERRLFELCKVVLPGIPKEDVLSVNFREIEARVSMKEQLDLWDRQMKLGLKSVEDMVMAFNPEIMTPEEARAFVAKNLESWARWVDIRRALNAPDDATEPGPSPQENGAKGPRVRDGVDEMADAAPA